MIIRFNFVVFFCLVTVIAQSQFSIIGQNGETPDEVLLVALEDVPVGQVFHFTDNEYSNTNDNFTTGEGILTFSTTAIVEKGDVFSLKNDGGWTVEGSTGLTINSSTGNLNISLGNEQTYLYQTSNNLGGGTVSSVLSAHDNVTGALPTELNPIGNHQEAIVIDLMTASRNSTFDGSRTTSDITEILNLNNWLLSDIRITLDLQDFAPSALPVELKYFQARKSQNENTLYWATASEIDNEGFSIEKSRNGIDFNKIAFVSGKGNIIGSSEYEFQDRTDVGGVNYYRLLQHDYDGQFSYSQTIVVEQTDELNFLVFPSIFTHELIVKTSLEAGSQIFVFDHLGTKIMTLRLVEAKQRLNLSSLNSGIYYIMLSDGKNSLTKKVIKL